MRRTLKTLGRVLVGLLVLIVIILAGGLIALQTDGVQRRLASLIERTASAEDGLRVEIGSIGGTLPIDVTVRDVVLSDPAGAWLTIDTARVAWRPLDLLQGRLTISAVEAGTIAVARSPDLPPGPEDADAGGGLPQPPVGIVLERLAIDAVALGQPLLGEAARLSVDGSARLTSLAEGLQAQLSIQRLDGVTGNLSAQVQYRPEEDSLAVTVALEEPAGGVVARAAQLPGLPPVTLSVVGSGPLDGWEATVVARAGDLGVIEADLGVEAVDVGRRLTLDAFALPGSAVGAPVASLLGERPTVSAAAVLDDAGTVAVERLAIAAAVAAVQAEGSVDTAEGRLAVDWSVTAGEPSALRTIVPDLAWEALSVSGRADGPFAGPNLSATVEGRDLRYATDGLEAAAAALAVDLTASPDGAFADPRTLVAIDLALDIDGARSGIETVDSLLDGPVTLAVSGSVSPAGAATVDDLRLTLPAGTVVASGTAEDWGATAADLSVRVSVPELAALGDLVGPLAGAADLEAQISRAEDETAVDLDGRLDRPTLGVPAVEALLGDEVTLAAGATLAADGAIDIDRLSVDGAAVALAADGVIMDGAVAAGWQLELPRLAALDAGVEGSARLSGDISGPFDDLTAAVTATAPQIASGGETITDLTVDAIIGGLPSGALSGQVSVNASWRDEPVALASRFALTETGGVRLEDVTIEAAGLQGGGSAALDPGGAVDGALEITADDLAPLSAIAGIELGGAATVRLSGGVGAEQGGGTATVTVSVDGLRVDGASVRTGTLTAEVADPLGRRAIEATLDAGGIVAAGETVSSLAATVSGRLEESFAFTVEASGDPAAVSTAGTLRLGVPVETVATRPDEPRAPAPGLSVTVDRLEGRFLGNPFRLTQATTVSLADGTITVDGLRVAGREGRIVADGRVGDSLDLVVLLEEAPLELLRLASPQLALTGRLDARMDLSGTRAAPRADLTVTADNIESDVAAEAGLPGFDLSADARWADGRMTARAAVSGDAGGRIEARAAFPLPAGPTGIPAVAMDAPLEASIDGQADIAVLNDLLAAGADRVTGTLRIAVTLGGTLGAPSAGGRIVVADASYQNALYGIELQNIQAEAVGDAQGFRLVSLTADTPGNGAIRAEGRLALDPAAGFPGRFDVTANNARLIDSDLLDAAVDADLRLDGALGRSPSLSGRVEIRRMTVRIAETLPGGVTTIEAVEVNAPPELAERVEADRRARSGESGGQATVNLALDLTIRAPGTVFVTGRGLDARMSGNLQVRGTANDPRIDGALTLDRGTLDILAKRFDFTRGEITFLGSALDPALDFRAETRAGDVTGIINVGGYASNPTLKLTSEPELPEDEVLARILFGKGTGQLSTFEAIQLGQQAAELAGVLPPGSGLIENVRRSVGIDVLNVETGESGDAELTAGQFVSEGVFVGVEQSLGSNETNVTVEIDITDNIRLETDVGSTGSTRVGIGMEFDY